jgi:hypothetical protein
VCLEPLLFSESRRWAPHPVAASRSQQPDPRVVPQGLLEKKQLLPQIGIPCERSLRSIGRLLDCPPEPCANARCIASDSHLLQTCLPTPLEAAPPCGPNGWGFAARRGGHRKPSGLERQGNLHATERAAEGPAQTLRNGTYCKHKAAKGGIEILLYGIHFAWFIAHSAGAARSKYTAAMPSTLRMSFAGSPFGLRRSGQQVQFLQERGESRVVV